MAVSSKDSSEDHFFGSGARAGDVIAERYRVERELGAGGMGQVLEVEHLALEKRFALKLIRPDRWDSTLEARFRREARALARVVSPRVAQVTDFGVDPARGPFYVMELLEGETLSELLERQGPLPRERALSLGIGIAAALRDVHEAGIVHRDVKPGNIGIAARGPVEVRLLDFGLATSIDPDFVSKITESHKIVGSLPYMAPEQFHAEKPTPRVDVWALGVVVYEMLTGSLPFDAPSTAALIHQVLAEEVPLDAPATRTCARAFERLLAKDPKARPADASEALLVLEDVLVNPATEAQDAVTAATVEATPIHPRVPPAAPVRRLTLWGVGLALIGVLALGASLLLMPSGDPADAEQPVSDGPRERLTEPAPASDEVVVIGTQSVPAGRVAEGESDEPADSGLARPADVEPDPARPSPRRAARPRRAASLGRSPAERASTERAPTERASTERTSAERAPAERVAPRAAEAPQAPETPPRDSVSAAPEPPAEPAWTGDIIELQP